MGNQPPNREVDRRGLVGFVLEFTAPNLTLNELAEAFGNFAGLATLDFIECERLRGSGPPAVGDEFRFRLTAESRHLALVEIVTPYAVLTLGLINPLAGVGSAATATIGPLIGKRRFDVRVVDASAPADGSFTFAVQTLSDHSYSGRRAWRAQEVGPGRFLIETAEFNGWAWLWDHMLERLATDNLADYGMIMWKHFLQKVVAAVGGSVTLEELPVAAPIIGPWDRIQDEPEVQRVLARFPALKEEADRLLPSA